MDRVYRILLDVDFEDKMATIDGLELGRIYCKHGMAHALDVARIMIKRNNEIGANIEKSVLYATALLHDIGRADADSAQDHAAISAAFAAKTLQKSGYSAIEIANITAAIAEHRQNSAAGDLAEILYFADKKSRPCYECAVADTCKWDKGKLNKSSY